MRHVWDMRYVMHYVWMQAQTKSAVKIQAWYRMMRYSRAGPLALVFRKNERKRKYAATEVQRVYRGHRARHDPDLDLRIEIRRLEHCCAIMIQSVTRGHIHRSRVRSMVANTQLRRMMNALSVMQRYVRGFRTRQRLKRERDYLMKHVRVIEAFCYNWFQPWQHRQHALLQGNLERIVIVQSKIRRFIALKHAHERRKTKQDFAVAGAWQILYWVVLVLLLCYTINERGDGAFNAYLHAVDSHLFPPPLPFSASSPGATAMAAAASATHARNAIARAVAKTSAAASGMKQTPAPAFSTAAPAPAPVAASPAATPRPSAAAPAPAPVSLATPAMKSLANRNPAAAAAAAAAAAKSGRITAPSIAQISQPRHFWTWLEFLLLPQVRLVGQTQACSILAANDRTCAPAPAPGSSSSAFQHDAVEGMIAAQVYVSQQRTSRWRYKLPYARTRNVYDACTFTRLGAGHVCLNVPEGTNTGLWETEAYGHAQKLQASTIQEYLNKSTNYTFFTYDFARPTLDAAGSFLASGSSSKVFGSTFLNFSFGSGKGDAGMTHGHLSHYPDGGFSLGAAEPSSSATTETQGRYASQSLNITDPAVTACGVPCERGLRGLALAEWLDSSTRAIVVTMATYSPVLNALVAVKALVEFGPGGGAVISRHTAASRLLPFGGGWGLPWAAGGHQMRSRIVPEIFLIFFGVVHLAVRLYLSLYSVHIERKIPRKGAAGAGEVQESKGYKLRLVRREGKLSHRLKHTFFHGWICVDLWTCSLYILYSLARLVAESRGATLVSKVVVSVGLALEKPSHLVVASVGGGDLQVG